MAFKSSNSIAATGHPPLSVLSATHVPSSSVFYPQCLQGELYIPLSTLVLHPTSFCILFSNFSAPSHRCEERGSVVVLSKSSLVAVAPPLPECVYAIYCLGGQQRWAAILRPERPCLDSQNYLEFSGRRILGTRRKGMEVWPVHISTFFGTCGH